MLSDYVKRKGLPGTFGAILKELAPRNLFSDYMYIKGTLSAAVAYHVEGDGIQLGELGEAALNWSEVLLQALIRHVCDGAGVFNVAGDV